MSAQRLLPLPRLAAVFVLAGLVAVSSCAGSTTSAREAGEDNAKAPELVLEAERTMHRAGGIAEFWLPGEVLAEEVEDEAPQDPVEFEAMLREAIGQLKQALELDPGLHRARFDIAVIYLRLLEAEPAEAWAKTFLEKQPNDPQGLELLSIIYLTTEKWRELAELSKAAIPVLEAGEEGADYTLDPCYFRGLAAIAHFHLGELSEARKWAEACIEADDEDPQGYCILGIIQHVTGDTEGLAETRAILRKLDPDAESTLDGIIENLEEQGLEPLLPVVP